MLVWLTELDLQLTNVEHFSESDVHHKIQQLNVRTNCSHRDTHTHTQTQLTVVWRHHREQSLLTLIF